MVMNRHHNPTGIVMPTKKPRITITLTERQHEVLAAMVEAGSPSMSSLIVELIELNMPTFESMALGFQRLRGMYEADQKSQAEATRKAQKLVEKELEGRIPQVDLFVASADRAGCRKDTGAAGNLPAPARERAPRTNRGVTTSEGKQTSR
jgi:hypothetical protein